MDVRWVILLNPLLLFSVKPKPVNDANPLPIVMEVRLVVLENALLPIDTTLFGIVIVVRPGQLAKALVSIWVTELAMVTEERFARFENAWFPMVVTPSSMTTVLTVVGKAGVQEKSFRMAPIPVMVRVWPSLLSVAITSESTGVPISQGPWALRFAEQSNPQSRIR